MRLLPWTLIGLLLVCTGAGLAYAIMDPERRLIDAAARRDTGRQLRPEERYISSGRMSSCQESCGS